MNILAIDIGGSKIAAGIVDGSGRILCLEKEQLPAGTGRDLLLDIIKSKCGKIKAEYDFDRIGITIPGLADAKNGVWVYAPFSGINNFPIAEIIGGIYNKRVYIENDVNACAVGEKRFGCCKDISDFIWITVSNGIGGAIFADGRLYTGHGGNAGEIGHIKVTESGSYLCGCGDYGCLEAVAAGPGISKRYKLAKDLSLKTAESKPLTAEQIAQRAYGGEKEATEIMDSTGYYIGMALASAINMLNPEAVIFGGGVSQSFDLIKPGIYSAFNKYLFTAANGSVKLMQTALKYNAALIGAAAITL
jgi:glucokinase